MFVGAHRTPRRGGPGRTPLPGAIGRPRRAAPLDSRRPFGPAGPAGQTAHRGRERPRVQRPIFQRPGEQRVDPWGEVCASAASVRGHVPARRRLPFGATARRCSGRTRGLRTTQSSTDPPPSRWRARSLVAGNVSPPHRSAAKPEREREGGQWKMARWRSFSRRLSKPGRRY